MSHCQMREPLEAIIRDIGKYSGSTMMQAMQESVTASIIAIAMPCGYEDQIEYASKLQDMVTVLREENRRLREENTVLRSMLP